MKLYHVVAVSENGVIGRDNRLPWHFSSDLKNFKQLTVGQTVMMGRRTFESIGSKPLPGRENFILTHLPREGGGPLKFFGSVDEALSQVKTAKAFIIGGARLFRETLERIDGIYLTRIHQEYDGDAYYPKIPERFVEKEKRTLQENPKIEFIYLENTERSASLRGGMPKQGL